MKLIIYPRLSTRSKRAIVKTTKQWGHFHRYEPKPELLQRLSQELGWTEQEVLQQIREERAWLLKHYQYFI